MKTILALLLALIMTVGLMGCMQPEPEETQPTEPSVMAPPEPVKKTIHILLPMTAEGWDGAAAAQAQTAAKALQEEGNYEIVTASYGSAEQQTQLLADIAAQSSKDGSVGVVTMPLAGELDAALAGLLEANVAYALAGTIPEAAASGSVANVQYDQHAIGAAAAAYLVSQGLEEGDKVLILAGLSDEEALRTEGFKLYLQGKIQHEGGTIADSWSSLSSIVYSDMQGTTREDAANYFVSFMDSSSNAKTEYIAAWDDAYVLGILDALEGGEIDADRKATFLDRTPHLTGFGGSKDLCDVLSGAVTMESAASFGSIATIAHSTDLLQLAVQAMADYFAGNVVEQDQTQPITWIDAENVSQHTGY